MPDALLTARGIEAGYGTLQVLFGVDLDVVAGEVVALLQDQNGNEKTLRSIMGPKGALLVFYRSADW